MVGYNEAKREVFCDLQCAGCGGFSIQACPMTGNVGNMRLAACRCLGKGMIFMGEYKPIGFWSREFCLDKETMPEIRVFPQYKGESPN